MEYHDLMPVDGFTFETFVKTPTNAAACAAARGIAEGKVEVSPLFICGGKGCGKTHLLNAIANKYMEIHPRKKVVLTTAMRMIANWFAAWREGTMDEFRRWYHSADLLLVDGLEALEVERSFGAEIVGLVGMATSEKRLIVFSTEKSSAGFRLGGCLDARYFAGREVEIEPMSECGRFEFLLCQLKGRGVQISDENVLLITKAVEGNAGELVKVAEAVREAAVINGGEATDSRIRHALASCGIEI